ncbi:MAG TPA: ATP-binding cassette domain-containing protein [Frankiaceae bacterium]|nr:ATP-binding cassette domain-containing protein [Frankiaceae bacterium]
MTAETELLEPGRTRPSASEAVDGIGPAGATGPGSGVAVATSGLTKRFGRHAAVDRVALAVPHGAVYGFLGPNGSGKTTTIRMLLGLVTPTGGAVELLGRPIPAAAPVVLPRVGALVEGPAFHPYLSGRDNLRRLDACDATADPGTRDGRVAAALTRVGLTKAATKRYRQYSLGMKQRLGLAAALLQPRDLLVLDEPTNGLDPQGTREVRTLVRELAADGTTVLVSSHLLGEVEQVATHVGIMSAGRLLCQGPLAEVMAAARPVVQVDTSDPERAAAVLRGLALAGVLVDAGRRRVEGQLGDRPAEEVTAALVHAGVPVRGLAVERPALEDLFVELTGEGFDVAS